MVLINSHFQFGHKGAVCPAFAYSFRGDIKVFHDAGIHRDEVNFCYLGMKADCRLVNQASPVSLEQTVCCFKTFRLLFVPGNQNSLAQGSQDLH